MRSRIFWSLVAFAATPLTVVLVFSKDAWVLALAIVGLLATFVGAMLVSAALMEPVLVLQRRLRAKNYSEPNAEGSTTEDAPSLFTGGAGEVAAKMLTFWAYVARRAESDEPPRLPSELTEIERLARAGRVSDLALESVKKDLFRHLSHQLKSPMALLRAHSQSARDKFDGGDPSAAADALSAIEEIAMNVSVLVEQLLSMAWVEGLEERGLGRSKVNLSSVLMQVVRFRRLIAEDKGIDLAGDVDAGVWVIGEQQLLQEMIASLIDNAIRYSHAGSKVQLEGRLVPSTRSVLVTITDQGPGIPPAERERVFEPFYGGLGADSDGKMNYGTRRHRVLPDGVMRSSHGLGLSLVRSVARLHGASASLSAGPNNIGLCASVMMAICSPPEEVAVNREEQGG